MSDAGNHAPLTDADLTAYLDGELEAAAMDRVREELRRDPGLRARLDILRAGDRPFASVFQPLLHEAPVERLESMLAALRAPPVEPKRRPVRGFGRSRMVAIAAVLVCLFVVGIAADRVLHLSLPFGELFWDAGEWRQAVADDFGRVSQASLASSADPQLQGRELEAVAAMLGTAIDRQQVALPRAEIRRARILNYEGTSVGQIAYLDPDFGPMALCVMRSSEGETPLRTEVRAGFNIAYWAGDGLAYMLIGKNPVPDLQDMARSLASRLPS
jgi:anti-sigma factor RsiW